MSLHLNPIEPSDWTDGPNEPDQDECPDCHGEGVIPVDSPSNHDAVETCERCGGVGYIEPPDLEGDD
jgi:DnaJ-class molecular chaperone